MCNVGSNSFRLVSSYRMIMESFFDCLCFLLLVMRVVACNFQRLLHAGLSVQLDGMLVIDF